MFSVSFSLTIPFRCHEYFFISYASTLQPINTCQHRHQHNFLNTSTQSSTHQRNLLNTQHLNHQHTTESSHQHFNTSTAATRPLGTTTAAPYYHHHLQESSNIKDPTKKVTCEKRQQS
jgi:hypothetical protein